MTRLFKSLIYQPDSLNLGTDGRIVNVAGAESKCNCLDVGCNCFDEDHYLATSTR